MQERKFRDIDEETTLRIAALRAEAKNHFLRVEELDDYCNNNDNDKLRQIFKMLPTGQTRKLFSATKIENLKKNRNWEDGFMAYDHSRVVLDCIDGDPNSDYIDACKIYDDEGNYAYIATQGPLQNTIQDYWRMVWQENIRTLIMVSNVFECGRVKCEQYWPEMTKDGQPSCISHDGIEIENLDEEFGDNCIIRTLKISKPSTKESRDIKHFHFIGWPEFGVPGHSSSISLLKLLLDAQEHNRKFDHPPIVVNCSAGIGRTGTVLCTLLCLEKAKKEGRINVFNTVLNLRMRRVNMVETEVQYIFIHQAVKCAMQLSCDSRTSSKE